MNYSRTGFIHICPSVWANNLGKALAQLHHLVSLLFLLTGCCIIQPIYRYAQKRVAVFPDLMDSSVVAFLIVNFANCKRVTNKHDENQQRQSKSPLLKLNPAA